MVRESNLEYVNDVHIEECYEDLSMAEYLYKIQGYEKAVDLHHNPRKSKLDFVGLFIISV